MKYDIEKIKNTIIQGDTLTILKNFPDNCIDTIITSPPYWDLRDYGVEGQIGLEKTLEEYLEKLLQITAELKRILKPTGVMFWNHSDSYCGSQGHFDAKNPKAREGKLIPDWKNYPKKCLYLQNYRLILKMIDEQGWILRNTIIWYKSNHMPSSVKDRFTNTYENIYMLVKNKKYFFDLDAVRIPSQQRMATPSKPEVHAPRKKELGDKYLNVMPHPLGKNPGDVWQIPTQPFPESHFAVFPEKLVEPMILAGCPKNGIVLDPFMGSGTTGKVAVKLRRNFIGVELNPKYVEMAKKRISETQVLLL